MEKRACERISANIRIRFYCKTMDYCGTVMNLSEKGMYISTIDMRFPFDSKFEMLLPLNEEVLNIHVKVSRITKTKDFYDGIGVELLDPPQNYIEFIKCLRNNL